MAKTPSRYCPQSGIIQRSSEEHQKEGKRGLRKDLRQRRRVGTIGYEHGVATSLSLNVSDQCRELPANLHLPRSGIANLSMLELDLSSWALAAADYESVVSPNLVRGCPLYRFLRLFRVRSYFDQHFVDVGTFFSNFSFPSNCEQTGLS
jgi:hypothetical protein